MVNYIAVFVGGGIGAVIWYVLSTWIGQQRGRSFPLSTFIINVTGNFLIGLLMTLMAERFGEPLYETEENINKALLILDDMVQEGIVALSDVDVIKYTHRDAGMEGM